MPRRFYLLFVAAIGLSISCGGKPKTDEVSSSLAVLSQSYLAVNSKGPLHVPPLLTQANLAFGAQQLQGHWSLLFFGYTACPLVCPKTLSLLSVVARGADGELLTYFVSIDPARDSPRIMQRYLLHFDKRIVGLTGSRGAIAAFSREVGVGVQPAGTTIDHSTSLFVVDPKGCLAGILLRPSDPRRILADLQTIRASHVQAHPLSH